jgi:hypothetical protein
MATSSSGRGDGTYELACRTGQAVNKVIVKDGQPATVELRVKLYDRSLQKTVNSALIMKVLNMKTRRNDGIEACEP